VRELGTDDKFEDEGGWRELVRTNDAVLVSIGILPRRILVNECYVDDARELLEEAGSNNNYETP
jgi:hypothetical protein